MKICIATDFSITPGGRNINEGPYSGEEFRKTILSPQYQKALDCGEKLEIDFDGCFGYATSFLEESFGGLVRERKEKGILDHIVIKSTEDLSVERLINEYVKEEEKKLS